jgi:hypothetical protein
MEDRLQVLKLRMEELTGKILGTAKVQEKIPPKQEQPKTYDGPRVRSVRVNGQPVPVPRCADRKGTPRDYDITEKKASRRPLTASQPSNGAGLFAKDI